MNAIMQRRARAVDLMKQAGLGAAAFVPGANFTYLTGAHLHLMERSTLFVLTRDGGALAVMPALEKQKWASAAPEAKPNRLIAVATASSKKLLAPISAEGAATQCCTPKARFSR